MLSLNNDTLKICQFNDDNDRLQKLKEWGLLTEESNENIKVFYKGVYNDTAVECDVIGYLPKVPTEDSLKTSYETVVLLVQGKIHKISPDYLREMQKGTFATNDFNAHMELSEEFVEKNLESKTESNKLFVKTVSQILNGFSKYEVEIRNFLSDNASLFIRDYIGQMKNILIPNPLPRDYILDYSSFIGTATGILIEIYLSRFQNMDYYNLKVNSALYSLNADSSWLVNAYATINETKLHGITDLSEIAMKFAAYESYFRCGKKSTFNPLNLKCSNYSKDIEVYNLIKSDVEKLTLLFIETFTTNNILNDDSNIIINPLFGHRKIHLKGDGDFIIDDTLYELKCLKANYELNNIRQLMFYYLVNIWNKYNIQKDDDSSYYICPYKIKKLKIFNPRYGAIMNVEIQLKDKPNIVARELIRLIKENSKLYSSLISSYFENFKDDINFNQSNITEKKELTRNFFKLNKEYNFVLKNDDYYDFEKILVEKVIRYQNIE